VLAVAKVAGIMAAKRTSELIPLCHPLPLTSVDLTFRFNMEQGRIDIEGLARVTGKTGVEMEALTAVTAAALTVYDMCKAVDREMTITDIRLVEKRGGRSGVFRRSGEAW
jgi:cyclic pyranopterin phosphate synthase